MPCLDPFGQPPRLWLLELIDLLTHAARPPCSSHPEHLEPCLLWACVQGLSKRAVELFDYLRTHAGPELHHLLDIYTYTTAVSVCSASQQLPRALELVAGVCQRAGVGRWEGQLHGCSPRALHEACIAATMQAAGGSNKHSQACSDSSNRWLAHAFAASAPQECRQPRGCHMAQWQR